VGKLIFGDTSKESLVELPQGNFIWSGRFLPKDTQSSSSKTLPPEFDERTKNSNTNWSFNAHTKKERRNS
jgi:hypothetical protein